MLDVLSINSPNILTVLSSPDHQGVHALFEEGMSHAWEKKTNRKFSFSMITRVAEGGGVPLFDQRNLRCKMLARSSKRNKQQRFIDLSLHLQICFLLKSLPEVAYGIR